MWDVSRAPVIDRATWQAWDEGYKVVNCLFAQGIVHRIRADPRPTLIMLQDYQLYLVARNVRDQMRLRPKHTLLHFIHTPWPGSTYWGLLPGTMRHLILDSLCAVDLLGFQTHDDALNFLRTCESYLPDAHVNFRRNSVWYRNHVTHVRDFPISIDVAALRQLAETAAMGDYRSEMQHIAADQSLIVRIDRIEPSKNIVRGFQAFEEMLELHPEHRGKVKFLALLVPSMLPPPAPFKIFVLLAGVVRIPWRKFALAILIGRGTRYLIEGWLALMYGAAAISYIEEHGKEVGFVAAALVLTGGLAYVWWQSRQARSTGL